MGFETGLKVAALCAVTLASNLVLATEGRMVNDSGKVQAHQTKPVEITESLVEKPQAVTSEPIAKPESVPVKKIVPPLELKGVRG